MAKPTVVLVIINSLKHSHAVELCQSAKDGKVKFVLAGIIPRIPTPYYQMPSTAEIEQRLINETETKLHTYSRILNIAKSDRYLIKNNERSIQSLARLVNAHLIIDDRRQKLTASVYTLITGKKPPHKLGEIPAIRSQEYLMNVVMTPDTISPIREVITNNDIITKEDYIKSPTHYAAITGETFFSLGGLFNWLAEKNESDFPKTLPRKSSRKETVSHSNNLH